VTGFGRRLVAGITAAIGLLVVASCGVPTDAQPRDIETQPAELPQDVAAATTDTGPRVYFLITPEGQQNDMLAAVTRAVAPEPSVVLEQLFKGVSGEETSRLRTAIPADTRLITSNVQTDGTLMVNVSDAFFKSTGDLQIKAVAQIVFTASEFSGVQRVKIEVDGKIYPWPRGDGTLATVALTPYDYPELDPTTQPDYPPLPSPTTSLPTSSTIPA
jgi:spore germination protein GerM